MRLSEVNSILLRAKEKVDRALIAEAAIPWLQSYGPKHQPAARDSISASVSQNLASACSGVKEARSYLERAIQEMFADINAKAIALAQADIEAGRAALKAGEE